MIIFLYGEDSYRSRQKLEAIKQRFIKTDKSGLNLTLLQSEGLDFDEFKKAVEASGFLGQKRLVILENPISQSEPELTEKLIKYQTDKIKSEEVIIVFWEKNQIDQRGKLFKYLKKNAQEQEFKLLGGHQLNKWIEETVKERGGTIDSQAVEKLAAYVGPDLWQMSNEINKLIAFNPHLTAENVGGLVKSKIENNIFNLIDALGRRDKKTALERLHEQEELGQNEIYILTMIVYQFRNLVKVRDCLEQGMPAYLIAQKTGLYPFVVRKSLAQARNFSKEGLKKIYQRLLDLDLAIKTGRIEPKVGLDMLIMEI